jgi:hypothetical protein
VKILIVIGSLGIWFLSQWALAKFRNDLPPHYDAVHEWTKKWNTYFATHKKACNTLLIISSLFIDALVLFIIAISIWGPSFRPFVALMVLFVFRQISQALVTLPIPPGSIWHYPGFPSLVVTYGIANDLFFSGHTALAVLGGMELIHLGYLPLTLLALFILIYETLVVLILSAHWSAPVICGYLDAVSVYFGSFFLA